MGQLSLLQYGLGVHVCILVVGIEGQLAEHIAPYHRLKAVFVGDLADTVQMVVNHVESVGESVLFEIFAQTDSVCLVHTDMYFARAEALSAGLYHALDQLIGLFLARKQYLVAVADVLVLGVPFEHILQMCQSLYAGNKLHSDACAVGVYLTQLLLTESAAQMSEIRLGGYLIGILGVEHQGVIAHFCDNFCIVFDTLHAHNGVAGAVQHNSEHIFHISPIPFVFCFLCAE